MQPDIQSGLFAADSVTRLLERLAYQVNAAAHNHDEDSVHELRIAMRRFSQSLSVFKRLYHAKELKKIRRRLKDLMDLSSDVRDCDVAAGLLQKSGLPGAPAIRKAIAARRKEAVRMLLPPLRSWSARRTTSKWRAALTPNGASATPLAEIVHDRLPRAASKFFKTADGASSATDLHQARILGKKLRYALEVIRPAYGPQVEAAIEQMRSVQSLLGKVHDSHAIRLLVEDLGGDADIESWLKKRERKKTREFHDAWAANAGAIRAALRAIDRPARKPAVRASRSAAPRAKTA